MLIFYLAKRSSSEVKKALVFFLFITIWVALSILPIHINNSDETNKIITTVLSIFPVFLTSFYILVGFVYVAFNKNADDDHKLNIIALLLILVSWVVSWSAIYMCFWTWYDLDAFPKLPSITEPYVAWKFMLGISAGIYSADQPFIADAYMSNLALLIGIHSMLCTFINVAILGVIVLISHEINNKRTKSSSQENKDYSDVPSYYSPPTISEYQYRMSVSD